MKDEKSPPSAAERAAATVAAAAAAAAAAEEEEESVAGEDNERHALLGTAAAAAAAEEREGAAPIESSGEPAAAAAGEPAAAAEAAAAAAARRPRTSLRPSSPPTAIRLLRKPERQALEDSIEAAKHKYFSFKTPSRSCEWLRCLPVLFLMLLVLYINTVYVLLHCLPQLQRALPPPLRDSRRFKRGTYELIAFAAISFLFLMSYWLAVTTPAGSIPDTPEWSLEEEEEKETSKTTHAAAIETKKGGGRRACKWCMKLKPDRSHHCRVCRKCILKMDHHCPWLFNCVGFNNHKFFFLALLWGDTLAIFVAATMLPSVQNAIKNEQVSFEKVFMLLFAETLDICLCVLMSGFLLFHSYLITNAVTTIEFCEKKYKKFSFDGQSEVSWSRGFAKNFIDAFGPDPLFWFFPVDNRLGDGLSFSPGFSFYFEGAEKERRIAKAARRYRGFDPIVDPDS